MKLKRKIKQKEIKSKKRRPPLVAIPRVFEDPYTGKWKGNFPYKPEMKKHEIIMDELSLARLAKDMMQVDAFAFDTETNCLEVLGPNKKFSLVDITISWGEKHNYHIPIGHLVGEDIDQQLTLDVVKRYLKRPFGRRDVIVIGHGLKFDMHVMKRIGIDINSKNLFDTMLACWLCDENTFNGLKEASNDKMGISQTKFKEVQEGVPTEVKKQFGYAANAKVPISLATIKQTSPYALADSFNTFMLYLGYVKELEDEGMDKIYEVMYIPFLLTLFKMEERGVSVDTTKLSPMGDEMQKDLDELQYKIYELAGVEFSITSNQQLAEILFGFVKQDKLFKDMKPGSKSQIKFIEKYKSKNNGANPPPDALVTKAKVNQNLIDASFGFRILEKTDGGAPSTNKDVIWELSQMDFKTKRKKQGVELCKYLGQFSKLQKLKTAFVDGLEKQMYDDGKVHPSFNQIGTDSGRISCSKPNLQQLPNAGDNDKYQIRSLFVGDIDKNTGKRKKIIAMDYKNLEMMCLAHYSKDKNLLEMFANNDDAHGSTAVNMFNLDCTSKECKAEYPHLRQAAKTLNFLLMYGGGANLLYQKLKSDHQSPIDLGSKEYRETYNCRDGKAVAQVYIDKYFDSYRGVAKFITNQKRFARKHKYVRTVLGRKRRLPDINSHENDTKAYNERLAVNSAIQGTAGDITISAQNRLDKETRLAELGCEMIIQVHDEIVYQCPEENVQEAIEICKWLMEHPFGDDRELILPLQADADFGDSYQEAK